VPSASTITAILRRTGHIAPEESSRHQPWKRFEAAAPNDLWQMDFKGHFEIPGGRCHPLTALDDHSRFSLRLQACTDETHITVQGHLIDMFRRYGLPRQMLFDNGPPWGSNAEHPYTLFTVWLMRLRIGVIHSRPHHPQTMGKEERFHRTLKAEVLQYCTGEALDVCQERFDAWREVYNLYRPHEALGMAVPASRYCLSSRQFPETLPPIEYGPDDQVRKVQQGGMLNYRGRAFRISKAFYGQPVALRPTQIDGIFEVFFCNQKITHVDLRK
jgi:transposase InsO family protein